MDYRFVIDLHNVSAQKGSWVFPIPRAWSEQAFAGCEIEATEQPGELVVEVTKTGEGYLVQGRVRLAVAATCVRCLQPVPLQIDAPVSALYVPGPAVERPAAGRKDDDESDEPEPDDGPDVEYFQNNRLVLDSYIRDTVLLEVPMNPRCAVECRLPTRPYGTS